MKRPVFLSVTILASVLNCFSASSLAAPTDLPSLGDSTSGIISQQQEFELGRTWLKVLRSQTSMVDDPLLKDYLERLLYRLAAASELKDHRLAPLVIDSPLLNAFAAPGGIVGVNTGLFLHAETEAQFAAVLAHELAHLSQRHYARNVEDARNKAIPTAAAILGSIILMATAGGDAGAAALTSTVAGVQSSRLRFSRQFEREADNLGIQTLSRAGFDPQAMADVFEQMNKSSRYGSRPPEFLLTHPVTQNRVADSRARADQISPQKRNGSKNRNNRNKSAFDYQLMRMRAIVLTRNNINELTKQLKKELDTGLTGSADITRYGLIMGYLKTRDFKQAEKEIAVLKRSLPDNLYISMLEAEIYGATDVSDKALKLIDNALATNPGNFPLLATRANLLIKKQEYLKARDVLIQLSRMRSEDPDIWFDLSEVQGQVDDILGLHQSRAEYYFLTGNIDDAIKHLQYAQKMAEDNFALKTKLDKKLADMHNYRQKLK